jgi:hypothetical protein
MPNRPQNRRLRWLDSHTLALSPGNRANLLEALNPPGWLADQQDAACLEADARVRQFQTEASRVGVQLGLRQVVPTQDSATLAMDAVARHSRYLCPHLDYRRPVAVWAVLEAEWLGCADCLRRQQPLPVEDDNLCRFCDQPSRRFRPIAFAIGVVTITAEACPDCAQVLGA